MKCVSVAILMALLCATASAKLQGSIQDVMVQIPFIEVEKNRDLYLPNVKCISDVVDSMLVAHDAEAKAWWDGIKERVIRQFTTDLQKCMAIQDPEEQLKCKKLLIRDGIEAGFEVPSKFVEIVSWEMNHKLQNKIVWKCFDLKAIMRLLKLAKQLQVLDLLPEAAEQFAEMNGDVAKDHGLTDVWTKTETKLKPHLDNWMKCNDKMIVLSAVCHLKEGILSAKLMKEYYLSIVQDNIPYFVQLIEHVRQTWAAPVQI